MKGRLGHAALALGLAQLIGCAQGYDSSLDEEEPPLAGGFAAGSTGAGRGGSASQAGGMSSAGRSGGGGGALMYMGDPCERGETEVCECEGGQGMGIRTCRQDDRSPTDGSFSPCEACVPDDDPAGMGGGGNGQSGSGSAGRGGSGGSTSSAGSSSSAGRSGSGGTSGRTGGSSGSSGGSGDPAWCFFVPVPIPGVCD